MENKKIEIPGDVLKTREGSKVIYKLTGEVNKLVRINDYFIASRNNKNPIKIFNNGKYEEISPDHTISVKDILS